MALFIAELNRFIIMKNIIDEKSPSTKIFVFLLTHKHFHIRRISLPYRFLINDLSYLSIMWTLWASDCIERETTAKIREKINLLQTKKRGEAIN